MDELMCPFRQRCRVHCKGLGFWALRGSKSQPFKVWASWRSSAWASWPGRVMFFQEFGKRCYQAGRIRDSPAFIGFCESDSGTGGTLWFRDAYECEYPSGKHLESWAERAGLSVLNSAERVWNRMLLP